MDVLLDYERLDSKFRNLLDFLRNGNILSESFLILLTDGLFNVDPLLDRFNGNGVHEIENKFKEQQLELVRKLYLLQNVEPTDVQYKPKAKVWNTRFNDLKEKWQNTPKVSKSTKVAGPPIDTEGVEKRGQKKRFEKSTMPASQSAQRVSHVIHCPNDWHNSPTNASRPDFNDQDILSVLPFPRFSNVYTPPNPPREDSIQAINHSLEKRKKMSLEEYVQMNKARTSTVVKRSDAGLLMESSATASQLGVAATIRIETASFP